ncbi:MAG: hypothetical protein O2973_13115 [Gemmatimonadetes bacterium]|nr:hypothetical protein [Gemmatimonadota bacterium]
MRVLFPRLLVARLVRAASLTGVIGVVAACAGATTPAPMPSPSTPDPRVGLKAGLMDAGEATYGMKVVAKAVSPPGFLGITNSDIAFTGNYAIQGNYNGPVIWDISNPNRPVLVTAFTCPASQNDISVYKNLMFMSAEANNGRVDCMPGGVQETVSKERFRGVRVFDITDIKNPRVLANVQTCRGSHTHTVLEDPKDKDNIYIYVSGSAGTRSPDELPGCVGQLPDQNPASTLMRIEVIKVPLANPAASAIVNRANIFEDLKAPATHAAAPLDIANAAQALAAAKAAGAFTVTNPNTGQEVQIGAGLTRPMLDSLAKARGAAGFAAATSADSAAVRTALAAMGPRFFGPPQAPLTPGVSPNSPTRQCHDITVYPARGLAGGACEGHGFLLDISDPVNPRRLDAVADSNFAYWHSATFNNDGTKLLFSDEWGGGGGPKCRASDKKEWGSDAIFSIVDRKLKFESYYKLPAAQTDKENCVAHNGSLIPIPGRDVMVQAWYQGGISVFDWTDAKNPKEIAFFDRGPVDSLQAAMGGSWSAYWYNGAIVSSEIARGMDVADLVPTEHISQNEIDAAKTVRWTHLNAQGQPQIAWPPSFSLAKSFVDQMERNKCMSAGRVSEVRQAITSAERSSGSTRSSALNQLSSQLGADASGACGRTKVGMLQKALSDLGNVVIP